MQPQYVDAAVDRLADFYAQLLQEALRVVTEQGCRTDGQGIDAPPRRPALGTIDAATAAA